MARTKYEDTPTGKMEDAYFRFNINGEGRGYGAATDNQWWRGSTRFCGREPVNRFMGRNDGSEPVFIYSYQAPNENMLHLWYAKAIKVPVGALGVFSHFEGDEIDVPSTHERVRFLMIAGVREFVMTTLPRMTANLLVDAPQSRSSSSAEYAMLYNYNDPERLRGVSEMRKWIEGSIGAYADYSAMFGLRWPEFPTMYRDQFTATCEKKLAAYQSPKAVMQRERAAARKIAMQALEIKVAKPGTSY